MYTYETKQLDDCAKLLNRARELIVGREEYNKLVSSGAKHMSCDFAEEAMIRAAAVLSAAAVNVLADMLDNRDEINNSSDEINEDADVPQAPETADDQAGGEAREPSETAAHAEVGADGEHPVEEPAKRKVAK